MYSIFGFLHLCSRAVCAAVWIACVVDGEGIHVCTYVYSTRHIGASSYGLRIEKMLFELRENELI